MTGLRSKIEKLLTQKDETKTVHSEIDLLKEDADLFKHVGPLLVEIPHEEAKLNITEREEWLEREISKTEKDLRAAEKKSMELQTLIQKQAQKQQQQQQSKK
eukprot:TRINITY_DN63_c0_g1_i1.p1 TRINITY_DN63_c0_g1~~TRINITY_DN63_c0_g1_i1.p1  ORF type:complete len:120 (+),score=41.38 TRINITY_DN63_c0_g1_i1:56-361(+)